MKIISSFNRRRIEKRKNILLYSPLTFNVDYFEYSKLKVLPHNPLLYHVEIKKKVGNLEMFLCSNGCLYNTCTPNTSCGFYSYESLNVVASCSTVYNDRWLGGGCLVLMGVAANISMRSLFFCPLNFNKNHSGQSFVRLLKEAKDFFGSLYGRFSKAACLESFLFIKAGRTPD